jgi:DNA-binding transcriptional regulator YdaS (Cro superfamily)
MTHRQFRNRTGADLARRFVPLCGLKPDSLRQSATLDREIPPERRRCLASQLEALTETLTEIARDLRAEDTL